MRKIGENVGQNLIREGVKCYPVVSLRMLSAGIHPITNEAASVSYPEVVLFEKQCDRLLFIPCFIYCISFFASAFEVLLYKDSIQATELLLLSSSLLLVVGLFM